MHVVSGISQDSTAKIAWARMGFSGSFCHLEMLDLLYSDVPDSH